ncbi:MAG: prevent-host-death protein [Acidobacteriota bacterium]|nr:prevent-host-death protein [Acidobacteriota bacterium]MDH3523505.1 prevent-host-death protein [Acidobacteriota bacterium]
MKAVGIKQLKARLSEYVRLARAGETVLVSDRDEVVAELGPPRHQRADDGSVDAVLDRLAERGCLTRSSRPKEGFVWSPPSLGLSPEAAGELLAELRGDR